MDVEKKLVELEDRIRVLEGKKRKKRRSNAKDKAAEFVCRYFEYGAITEHASGDLVDAAEAAGINNVYLSRVKRRMGIVSKKQGRQWSWQLPPSLLRKLSGNRTARLRKWMEVYNGMGTD